MASRPPGRRTESLFDNRYRYDYIYPRGRSGETLRAYDILDQDRPVVIKRPAPQDAPPMRAGQEVNIRAERQALERLSGHPVLTELRGGGSFRIGGQTHDYIVMDLAQGRIVEDLVLELAEQGRTLPELETLVIMDRLLDLLAFAHDKQVIYNDVDAKHLFWDRDTYKLKVIDWGNAVFMDEPSAQPNVSRTSDIYQCGELLYFILTGGNRLAIQEDSDTFFINFGPHADQITAKLQAVITRAANPDPKRRFGTIMELRHALSEVRQPLEKTREDLLSRVRKRVRPTASKEELEELAEGLHAALDMDPGYPDANALAAEIQFYLKQIAIQSDLDAARIYLESGNWPRALSLLHDLLPGADEINQSVLRYLIGATALLETERISPPPAGFLESLDSLFQHNAPDTGQILLSTPDSRPEARRIQWLLAEQLTTQIPDVVLLRPHLIRLRDELVNTSQSSVHLLDEIDTRLAQPPLPGLAGLRVNYEQIGDLLARLEEEVSALAAPEECLASIIRAQRAAHSLIERLNQVGLVVFSDPSQAANLLRQAALIDPTSPYFDALNDYFDEVHQAFTALKQFKPKGDGTSLTAWFGQVQSFLQPYLTDLPDPQLHAAADAIHDTGQGWVTVLNYLALGRRQPTIDVLRTTADIIRPYNEQIAAWFGTFANRLPDAPQIERLSPNTALTEILLEGLKAWDRGDGAYTAELGRKAYEQAATDGERLAASRVRRLGEILDGWLSGEHNRSVEYTDQAETNILAVLLSDEEQERRAFAEQMPNTTLYLRAMSRGIVAYMQQSSSAGWRALYMHYVLRGMLALLTNEIDEAEFWRNAASKVFDDARTHRAFQVLDRTLTGKRLVETAEQVLNAVSGPADLEGVRRTVNAPLANEWLSGVEQSVQQITDALRSWSDGLFYAAKQYLDNALSQLQKSVETSGLKIDSFIAWVTNLRDVAADLQQARLLIEQTANSTQAEPNRAVAAAHRHIVTETLSVLGPDYAHQVRQWEDMYLAVLESYTSTQLTQREKLAAFGRHFTSLFITKHPAYPLFRHWQEIVEQMPSDEIEESEPVETPIREAVRPHLVEEQEHEAEAMTYFEDERPQARVRTQDTEESGDLPWNWIIAAALLILLAAGGFGVWRYANRDKEEPNNPGVVLLPTNTIEVPTQITASPVSPTEVAMVLPAITETPSDEPTPMTPTATLTEIPTDLPTNQPTETPGSPTLTPTPFVTSTLLPTETPAPTEPVTPTSAAPRRRDILQALDGQEALPWEAEIFRPGDNGTWMISSQQNSPLVIELTPDLLNALFRPGAANTLVRVDVTLELVNADQAALASGNVAFGLGVENAYDERAIAEAQFTDANLVNLGINQNNQFTSRTQVPIQTPRFTFSIRRVDDNTLVLFVNEERLGDSVFIFAQGEPVMLFLYTTGINVEAQVSSFEIDYNLRVDIP